MTFGIHQSRFNIRGFNIHGSHAKVCGLFLFIKNKLIFEIIQNELRVFNIIKNHLRLFKSI